MNITDRMAGFSPTLDLRGERAEDALTKTMSFADDAVMLGMPEVKFVHGRGNGVLPPGGARLPALAARRGQRGRTSTPTAAATASPLPC
ncbi:MAG: Smr/MutS family protein [Hymenobacter sp.]